MGSASEMDRSIRFIDKFGGPLLGKLGIGVGTTLEVISESLSNDTLGNMVQHVVTARVTAVGEKTTNVIGDDVCLIVAGICTDLFDPENDNLEETQDRLDVLSAVEVARLWAEADL